MSSRALPFTGDISSFHNNHVVSISQFDKEAVLLATKVAGVMKKIVAGKGGCDVLKHKVLANVFYEPSTRTSSSFAAAMQRLGGSVLQISENTSSAVKGETLSDSIKTLQCYADLVVLRHPQPGSATVASEACTKPILNAGDGIGEHPTQALLDFLTISEEIGAVDGITVTMVGDLKNGRTVHSLSKLLAKFNVKLNFVAPSVLSMPQYIKDDISKAGVTYAEYDQLNPQLLSQTDVLYVTRVQKERFASIEEYESLKHYYIISKETLSHCKEKMAIMHPLPRVGEILEEVDSDPRAAYFRQMQYGLYMRMALLALVSGISVDELENAI